MKTKKQPTLGEQRAKSLEETYSQLLERLCDVRTMFDYALDAEIIDALIYEENAILCRLERLYKDAREGGISLPIVPERKS